MARMPKKRNAYLETFKSRHGTRMWYFRGGPTRTTSFAYFLGNSDTISPNHALTGL